MTTPNHRPPIPTLTEALMDGREHGGTDSRFEAQLHSRELTLEMMSGQAIQTQISQLGSTRITTLTVPQATLTWEPAPHKNQPILVAVARVGGIHVSRHHGAIVRGGVAAVLVAGPARVHTTAARNELLVITMDRALAPAPVRELSGRVDGPELSPRQLTPLHLFLHLLASTTPQTDALRQSLSDAARSVAAEVVAALGSEVISSSPAPLFENAMDFLVVNYGNLHLTVALVAARLGVASRTLQAAFTARGTTFSTALRKIRVDAAREIQSEHPSIPAANIAMICGFSSLSTMYRAFKSV